MLGNSRTQDSPESSQKIGGHHEGDGSIILPSDTLSIIHEYNPRAFGKDELVV